MNKKLLGTVIVFLSQCFSSSAQLTIDGEIRPRAEYRHGYKSVADSNQASAFSVDQRTRLNAHYTVNDYELYVSIQDVRTWGANSQLNVTDGFLHIHQAWAKVNFNKKAGLKLGRQEISYDDQRMMGAVGWLQQARSHDAAIMQFKGDKTQLDIGIAYNQNGPAMIGNDYNVLNSYRDLHYAWLNCKISDKIQSSLLAMNVGQQVYFTDASGDVSSSMKYVLTLGTHTKFNLGRLKLNFNGFYQMGSAFSTPHVGKSAYLIGLDADYTAWKKINFGFGYETQSGTTQTDTTEAYAQTSRVFNPFFGTNHKFNGLMDYFYVGDSHGNVGLQDLYLRMKYKKDKWNVGLDAHIFLTGIGVEVPDGIRYNSALSEATTQAEIDEVKTSQYTDYLLGSVLGTELDFSFTYKLKKSVTLKVGYAQLFASETLASLKGTIYTSGADSGRGRTDQINNWGYIMFVFKPTLFKSKEE